MDYEANVYDKQHSRMEQPTSSNKLQLSWN